MFDQQSPLPSNYGYAGEEASQLSSLASGEGALPGSYGEAKPATPPPASAPSATKNYAAPKQEDALSAFATGASEALQQSGVFQSSGKASPPMVPSAGKGTSSASSKWKVYAALGGVALVVGGALWYASRRQES